MAEATTKSTNNVQIRQAHHPHKLLLLYHPLSLEITMAPSSQRGPQLVANAVYGNISLPAVVFVWTGVWIILDIEVPGGSGLWKELIFFVVGTGAMLWTGTYFSNAGMECWDEDRLHARLRATLETRKLTRREKFSLYANSLIAMAGSIAFWDGVYTICEEHVWANTLRYNMLCGVLGGVGIVWVTVSERNEEDGEEEKEEEDRNAPNTRDSTDPDAVNANNNVSTCRLEGGTIDVNCCVADNDIVPRLSYSLDDDGDGDVSERGNMGVASAGAAALDPAPKTKLYVKGMFGNVCAVVFWKGVENIILQKSPKSAWSGLVVYVAGVFALLSIGRWMENCGLEANTEAKTVNERPKVGGSSSKRGQAALGGEASKRCTGSLYCPWRMPEWITTTVELTAVVAAWTGVEMYIWEEDYITRPWYRDWCYIVGGLAVLLATTFLNVSTAPLGGVARMKPDLASLLPLPPTAMSSPSLAPIFSLRPGGNKRGQQECEMAVTPSAPAPLVRSEKNHHVWPRSARCSIQANGTSTMYVEGLPQEDQVGPRRSKGIPAVAFVKHAASHGVRPVLNRTVGLSERVALHVFMC